MLLPQMVNMITDDVVRDGNPVLSLMLSTRAGTKPRSLLVTARATLVLVLGDGTHRAPVQEGSLSSLCEMAALISFEVIYSCRISSSVCGENVSAHSTPQPTACKAKVGCSKGLEMWLIDPPKHHLSGLGSCKGRSTASREMRLISKNWTNYPCPAPSFSSL